MKCNTDFILQLNLTVLEWILTSDEIQVKWGTRMSKRILLSLFKAGGEGVREIVNMSQAEGAPAAFD